jgi:GNAT superfamily N-acetyltransferase
MTLHHDGVLGLKFRYATGEDVPQLVALVERAYRTHVATKGWTTESHPLTGPQTRVAVIDRIVADPESRFVLAESNAAMLGRALVPESGDGAYLGMFAVDPLRQAAGIGTALLAACEDPARELRSAQAMTRSVISPRSDLI